MWQYDKMTDRYISGEVPSEGQMTACYTRLSQEDEQAGDSDSIQNQRALLKYCTDHHFQNVRFFSDDGWSGTNFDRPGFTEMMELVEQGRIKTIVVKDGCDNIELKSESP